MWSLTPFLQIVSESHVILSCCLLWMNLSLDPQLWCLHNSSLFIQLPARRMFPRSWGLRANTLQSAPCFLSARWVSWHGLSAGAISSHLTPKLRIRQSFPHVSPYPQIWSLTFSYPLTMHWLCTPTISDPVRALIVSYLSSLTLALPPSFIIPRCAPWWEDLTFLKPSQTAAREGKKPQLPAAGEGPRRVCPSTSPFPLLPFFALIFIPSTPVAFSALHSPCIVSSRRLWEPSLTETQNDVPSPELRAQHALPQRACLLCPRSLHRLAPGHPSGGSSCVTLTRGGLLNPAQRLRWNSSLCSLCLPVPSSVTVLAIAPRPRTWLMNF